MRDLTGDPLLSRIYWLGGSPCAGKSTIADRLAARHGMTIYRCDDAFPDHAQIVDPDTHPTFHRLINLNTDDLWLRPVTQQISEEIELYREEFPLILDDLLALPSDSPIIAEGAALLPDVLAPLDIAPQRMLWMVPSEAFQREHYEKREWRHDILRDSSDPDRAWQNWMSRDAGFAREVTWQAKDHGLRSITVDGTRSLDDNDNLVRTHFNLGAS